MEKGMKVYTYLFADYMILGVPKADEEQSKGANKLGKMMEKKPYVLLTLISYELVKVFFRFYLFYLFYFICFIYLFLRHMQPFDQFYISCLLFFCIEYSPFPPPECHRS